MTSVVLSSPQIERGYESKMDYKPLVASRKELRLLYPMLDSGNSTVRQSPNTDPLQRGKKPEESIRLEMRTVSLEDLTQDSREFMLSKNIDIFPGSDYLATLDSTVLALPSKFESTASKLGWFEAALDQGAECCKAPNFGRWRWGDYITLSYCWGEESPMKFIEINGVATPIRENLWDFLHAVYGSCTPNLSCFERTGFWVDAICINQGDSDELNVQVKRMKEIYSLAIGCRAWLGKSSSGSAQVMDILFALGKTHSESIEESMEFIRADMNNKALFPIDFWTTFSDFVTRPYWERLWVVQELALSHQNVVIMCGSRILPWSVILYAIVRIRRSIRSFQDMQLWSSSPIQNATVSNGYLGMARITILFDLGLRDLGRHLMGNLLSRQSDLHRVLRISTTSKATRDEDRVYGVLGLFEQGVTDLVHPELGTSRKKSVEGIFVDFAKAVILGTGNLSLLVASGGRRADVSSTGLPTWVPDLRIAQDTFVDLVHEASYKACGEMRMEVSFDGDRLCITGFVIDKVGDPKFANKGSTYSSGSFNSSPYGDEAGQRDALQRTLLAGRDHSGNIIKDTYPSPLDLSCNPWNTPTDVKIHELFLDVNKVLNSSFNYGGKYLESFFKQKVQSNEQVNAIPSGETKAALEWVGMVLWKRRLFTTRKGYIGLASENVRQGDSVCILPGLDSPAILRRNEDGTYLWIGDAYIHGLMEGQAVKWIERGSYTSKRIVIV